MRSATKPTSGTLSPPVPQPKPIMIDDTVAALTGASDCANVTFTGKRGLQEEPAEGEDRRRTANL